jgi:type III secretion protein W
LPTACRSSPRDPPQRKSVTAMTDRIDSNIQAFRDLRDPGRAPASAATGRYRGEQVTQQARVESPIQDAAEELTFSASETVEKRKKKLASRKTGRQSMMSAKARELAQTLIKKLPDLGKAEKLRRFFEHLKQNRHMTPRQMRQEAGKFFKDVSHQHAALSFCIDMAAREGGGKEMAAALDGALESLMEEHGPQVRAGLNISAVAKEIAAKGFSDVQELRDFYRDTVLQHEGLNDLFKGIAESLDLYVCPVCGYTCRRKPPDICPTCGGGGQDFVYNETEFLTAVEFLIKAVGGDLQSRGPSISSVELKKIIDDLYQVEVLGNVHRSCFDLRSKIHKSFRINLPGTPIDLMGQILTMQAQTWHQSDDILNFSATAAIRDLEAKIYFLRELVTLIKTIPLKVYPDADSRFKIITAAQEALDTAIEMEEEALE